jgi:sugar/nucleoside kinase (ribokinase family)
MDYAINSGILKKVDLLAINMDEASRATISLNQQQDINSQLKSVIEAFCHINSKLLLSITHGKYGSWTWDGSRLEFFPSLDVPVISTAGAGDAFISGVIAGITCGLSLREAQQLGTLSGSASVTSPHTINKDLNRQLLYKLQNSSALGFSSNVKKLLEEK